MALDLSQIVTIESFPARFTDNGDMPLAALDDDEALGVWMFNKAATETSSQAADRCSQNLAVGAPNDALDRQWSENKPTVNTDWVNAREDAPLVTRLPSTSKVYGLVAVRCTDGSLASTGNHRGFIIGSYGNTINRGWALYFNSTVQMRLLTYDGSGTLQTLDKTYTGTPFAVWRIFEFYIDTAGMTLADKTLGDAASTKAITGHSIGEQTVTLLGRITTGTDFDAAVHKDFAIGFLASEIPDAAGRAALLAQMRDALADTAIIEGA